MTLKRTGKDIQIQHLLKLNLIQKKACISSKWNSNTTLVKVKYC